MCDHVFRVSFQIQVFSGDNIAYQRLQGLANMDGLFGSNVMKSDIDIHRMPMDHISKCMRALYLLFYRELDPMSLSNRRKIRMIATPGTI